MMENVQKKRLALAELLKKIEMSETYSQKILSAFDMWISQERSRGTEQLDIPYIRKLLRADETANDQLKIIMLFLVLASEEYENGVWKRFPEDIFISTMSDFSSFVRFYKKATGEEGYGKWLWPFHYVDARIFRLGAFEYELIEENGKRRIEMHIPEGTELLPNVLKASLIKKNEFFAKYFPDWQNIPIECNSWMLSPALRDMLPEGSKILWFQSMFDIFETDPDNKFYMQFAFGLEYFQWCNGYDLTKLREDTSLQRKLKQFVLNGGVPGAGRGYLKEAYALGLKET